MTGTVIYEVDSIKQNAFKNKKNVTLTLNESIKSISIGDDAFTCKSEYKPSGCIVYMSNDLRTKLIDSTRITVDTDEEERTTTYWLDDAEVKLLSEKEDQICQD